MLIWRSGTTLKFKISFFWFGWYRRELLKPPKHRIHNKTMKKTKKICKSLKIQLSCLFEGLGPLPNCRSHFSDSNKKILSSGNPMGASLVTKQCSETFHEVFLKHFVFYIISWALEALGPLPNCRSHFCGSNRVIESFWNPQGTSFVTKQCPKCIAKIYAKSRHKKKWWLYLWNSPGGGKELLKFSQSTILLSLNTTYTRIPFLRPVNQMY